MESNTYPNETIELLLERASVRHYTDEKITPEVLDYILKAGIQSASGGNLQLYSVIIIEDTETRKKLAEMCWQDFIAEAPVNLLFCLDFYRMKTIAEEGIAPFAADCSFMHFWISFQDALIAASSICTAADSLGLGSCYIGTIMGYHEETIKMFELPQGVFPIVLLTLGYPAVKKQKQNKFDLDLMVHHERYRKPDPHELFEAYLKRERYNKISISADKLDMMKQVCTNVGGSGFASRCLQRIEDQDYINPIQYRFGLHYPADGMTESNEEFVEIMKKQGLRFFEKWEGYKEE